MWCEHKSQWNTFSSARSHSQNHALHAALSLTFIIMIMIIVEIYIVRNVYYISRGIARQWPGGEYDFNTSTRRC